MTTFQWIMLLLTTTSVEAFAFLYNVNTTPAKVLMLIGFITFAAMVIAELAKGDS